MTATVAGTWVEANQQYLKSALDALKESLQTYIARAHGSEPPSKSPAIRECLEEAGSAVPAPSALDVLCSRFGLSPFERDVLLLCAAPDFDSEFAALCAAAHGDARRPYPTFSLALSAFSEPHWNALSPAAPLRDWRLIELVPGESLTTSPLKIDERILHYLAGVPCLEERLRALTEPLLAPTILPPSQQFLAETAAGAWSRTITGHILPVIQLYGENVSSKRAVAAAICIATGLNVRLLSSSLVPRSPSETDSFARMWEREAALNPSALLLEIDESSPDPSVDLAAHRLAARLRTPLIVSAPNRQRPLERPVLCFDVAKPSADEQRDLWRTALGPAAATLNGSVDALVSQFSLSTNAICAAASQALESANSSASRVETSTTDLAPALWQACRAQSRPHLDGLAQRIEPAATWDDLILPDSQRQVLSEIAVQVRQRAKVYHTWDFVSKGTRGLGISALFSGPSGTGKTMASEVLAHEMRLDLYRVDLSQVVSKYIGETEKNLRRVFDAADEGSAVLLFDEADALFGKRSEVKDSHDRYANVEISYLLQRMESYRGLGILATNLKSALDPAFLRRIRFLVQFPFPGASERAEIWRRIFPAKTPTEGLKIDRLARLNVTGGNIRNIAMNAAFIAAEADQPVRMLHLLRAARSEYSKLEKTLTESETAGWL